MLESYEVLGRILCDSSNVPCCLFAYTPFQTSDQLTDFPENLYEFYAAFKSTELHSCYLYRL